MTAGTVVVTGALGQVGTRCADILLSRGHTVVALDVRNEKSDAAAGELAARSHPGTLITAFIDLRDTDAVNGCIATHQPDAIVHLAGILAPSSYRNPVLSRAVNVGGTENLVKAALVQKDRPLFVFASSASVYGSRNPHRHPERITASTPVNPIDQYGEDKVLAETVIRDSGLPFAILRLGGVISPDGASNMDRDYLLLMRATPRDNRLHAVDARDVGLAFANAAERRDTIAGKTFVIGGNETCVHLQRDLEDDMMQAMGLGRLGSSVGLPGDPDDDRGWSFTGWFDTTESQALLDYQKHDWAETIAWITAAQSRGVRAVLGVAGPVIRPVLRATLRAQNLVERRGVYADPWTFIAGRYGPEVLAKSGTTRSP